MYCLINIFSPFEQSEIPGLTGTLPTEVASLPVLGKRFFWLDTSPGRGKGLFLKSAVFSSSSLHDEQKNCLYSKLS